MLPLEQYGRSRVGRLVAPTLVYDETSGRRLPLREALPDDEYTLLVEGRLKGAYRELVQHSANATGVAIRTHSRSRHRLIRGLNRSGLVFQRARISVIRPDGYVAFAGRQSVLAGLARLAEPARDARVATVSREPTPVT